MKILDQDAGASSAVSYAGLNREDPRYSVPHCAGLPKLERPEIEKLLRRRAPCGMRSCNSRNKERFVNAAAAEPTRSDLSRRERRKALIDRSFIFEGAFGDNPSCSKRWKRRRRPRHGPAGPDRGESWHRQGADGQGHPRQRRPLATAFVSVNCGRFPTICWSPSCRALHKGAFTGAVTATARASSKAAHTAIDLSG